MIRVLVCGGRDYFDRDTVFDTLDAIHRETPISEVIHGGAKGADALGGFWALSSGVFVTEFPADWQADGRRANR